MMAELRSVAAVSSAAPVIPAVAAAPPVLRSSSLACVAMSVALLAPASRVHAAAEEIQVYMDDLSAPGRFGLDVHNNYVASGAATPDYPGAQPPLHVYRLTPEFYYGLSDTLELGGYLLGTHTAAGDTNYDGAKLRLKYVAPHDASAGPFWGANLEVGRTDLRVSPAPWNAELKGIFGYRGGAWTFAVNPNIDWSLSAHGGPATAELDFKIACEIRPKLQVGIENYDELGPLSGFTALRSNSHVTYLALDRDFGSFDLNAGVGRGWTAVADRWVFKFIAGFHF